MLFSDWFRIVVGNARAIQLTTHTQSDTDLVNKLNHGNTVPGGLQITEY